MSSITRIKDVGLMACGVSLLFLNTMPVLVDAAKGTGRDLVQSLNLTADQRAQLDVLKESMRLQKEQYRAKGDKPDREEIKAQREAFGQGLEAILTSEQLVQLQEIKAGARGRGHRGKKGDGWRGRGGFMGGPTKHVLRQLDLSEDQRRSLQEVREAHHNNMERYREAGQKPEFEVVKAHREALKESFEAILTPDQLTKLSELRSRREERGGPGGRHRGHRIGAFRLKGLDLSEDQKAQLRALWEDAAQEIKQAGESGLRPSREDRRARRQSMREAIAGVLTPEQRQQLEERRARHREGEGKGGGTESAGISGFGLAAETAATALETKSWGQIKTEQK